MYNTLTCLFGHHDYGKEITIDKYGYFVYLCKICKRSGYYKWNGTGVEVWYDYNKEGNCIHKEYSGGPEGWFDFDEKGNLVHAKWSHGEEVWYNKRGTCFHRKFSVAGVENGRWKANNGRWVNTKPKNWKYEKQIQ